MTAEPEAIQQHRSLLRDVSEARGFLDACLGSVITARERLVQVDLAGLLADEHVQKALTLVGRDPRTQGERLDKTANLAVGLAAAIEATVEVVLARGALQELKPLLSASPLGETPEVFVDGTPGNESRTSTSLLARAEAGLSTAADAALSEDLRMAATAERHAIGAGQLALQAAEAGLRERQARVSGLEARVGKVQGASFAGQGWLVIIVSGVVIVPIAQLLNAPILALVPLALGFIGAKVLKSMRLESVKRALVAETELRNRLMEFVAKQKRATVQRRGEQSG